MSNIIGLAILIVAAALLVWAKHPRVAAEKQRN